MTEVVPVSMRILPSLARVMFEADCCGAPPWAYCVVVWHWAQAGGCGGVGSFGDTAPKAYHARKRVGQGLPHPETRGAAPYHTRQTGWRTMGWPALQENALANSGMLDTTPLMRY